MDSGRPNEMQCLTSVRADRYAKHMATERLCRSFQTAPVAADREDSGKYLESGFTRDGFEAPDWLVPDLEDGIAPSRRSEGIDNTVRLTSTYADEFTGEVWPRIQWSYDDPEKRSNGTEQIGTLIRELGAKLTGFVVPKVGRLEDVERAVQVIRDSESDHGLPDGTFEMSPIIETARAKSDLREIARFGADSRIHGLVFGPVDYAAEVGGRKIGGTWPTWRELVADLSNETSANGLVGIGGPFDQIFHERAGVTVYNADRYAEHAEREARYGLDGSWSLHPNQTVQANRIHMPSPAELEEVLSATEAFLEAKHAGSGVIVEGGQMVDEGTFKNYVNTLRSVLAIHDTHPEQTDQRYSTAQLDRVMALESEL